MLSVERGLGHPWSDEPGWDRLIVTGRKELLHRAASDAREKWWRQLCVVGDVAVFYKPSGATAPWDDKEHWLGFDSEGAVSLKHGDVVITQKDAKKAPSFRSGVNWRVENETSLQAALKFGAKHSNA